MLKAPYMEKFYSYNSKYIHNALALRDPQHDSLEIFARLCDVLSLRKNPMTTEQICADHAAELDACPTNDKRQALIEKLASTAAKEFYREDLAAVRQLCPTLYFLILSSFLNIVLDIFFIATLHMGTAGAAWATVLSQGISALLCFWYMFHNYNNLRLSIRDLYPDPYRILCMIQSGIPMALNQTVTAFGIMILQSGINQFGSSVMAAYTAASKLESLVMQPMIALGSGISTYCAQNIGARKTKRIFVGVRSTMLLSLGAAILGMALYGIASKAILRIFLSDPSPEMVHYALQYLYTSVWFLLFLAWIFLFRNALVGLGNGLITIIGGVAELLCRFLCIHFLLQPFGFWCICLTNPITWIVACSLFCGFYFRWEHQQKHCSKSAR